VRRDSAIDVAAWIASCSTLLRSRLARAALGVRAPRDRPAARVLTAAAARAPPATRRRSPTPRRRRSTARRPRRSPAGGEPASAGAANRPSARLHANVVQYAHVDREPHLPLRALAPGPAPVLPGHALRAQPPGPPAHRPDTRACGRAPGAAIRAPRLARRTVERHVVHRPGATISAPRLDRRTVERHVVHRPVRNVTRVDPRTVECHVAYTPGA
jgi:hypothetical protein